MGMKARDPKRHFLLPLAFWVHRCLKRHFCSYGYVLDKPKSAVSTSTCSLVGEVGVVEEQKMEVLVEKGGERIGDELFTDSSVAEECPSTESSSSEDSRSGRGLEESSKEAAALGWPMAETTISELAGGDEKTHQEDDKPKPSVSDIEMMKERFSKLLLGEDMSGCGKGVCTALAISNAITNLCATIFGQLWRLEPLSQEKKSMWRREMDCFLSVSDHIVELMPTWQTFKDGSQLEVMTCRPRVDLCINLPAVKKLDNMLLDILDSFKEPEFWYVDQGILAPDCDDSASFRRSIQRQEEKWWLPVPRVPPGGLLEKTKKQLQHKRDCTHQILKAAVAINSNSLAEMEVPESYLDALPKNGRESLGDVIHRYITSDQFSPECLLDCLEFSSEHQALEIANRVEASTYVWRQKHTAKSISNATRPKPRSSWGIVKEMVVDADKRELFADRAESLLICLKQRFPGLTQTTLDICKIQCNKDVGKSILESYSRVLESLAFNIVARIDDVLYVDNLATNSDQSALLPPSSIVAHKRVTIPYSVPVSSTPFASSYATPSFSPAPLISPAGGERSPFINRKVHGRGFGVKKVLTSYLSGEAKGKDSSNVLSSQHLSQE